MGLSIDTVLLSAVNSSKGRFPSGRATGYRNDGARGRGNGNYGSGQGYYGRGDFNGRAEFGSRSGNRGGYFSRGEGYQRGDHMGGNGGRVNRAGGLAVNASRNTAPQIPATA